MFVIAAATACKDADGFADDSVPFGEVPNPALADDAAGIELRPVDGGPDYFSKWPGSFPADPAFFPIGVWAESFVDDDQTRQLIDDYAAIGVNTFPGPYGAPVGLEAHMRSKGMWFIGFDSVANAANTTTDEPDLRGCAPDMGDVAAQMPTWLDVTCRTMGDAADAQGQGPTSPAVLSEWSDALRTRDPSRPVYGQFTKVPRIGSTGQDYWVGAEAARDYVDSADIVSFDWYVLTDAGHYTPKELGNVWTQGDAVRVVRWLADEQKPVWPMIETSYVHPKSDHRVSPAEVNAEVWQSIIAGARGIQYFNHDFKIGTTRVLFHPDYTDIHDQVALTNQRIHDLAPVLNGPYADGLARVGNGRANLMAKAHEGSYYVFAGARSRKSQDVTIDLAPVGATSAEVLFENRSVPVEDGHIVDSFADGNAVHIYKLTPSPG